MCRFTRIYRTQCGHYTLSNTSEHTELCEIARDPDEEIRQGFDKAPAFCHPLPEDLEELGTQYRDSDRIAQTNYLYTSCDLCKQSPHFSSEPRGAGSQIEKPVEQFGKYTDEDMMDLAKWCDLLLSNATTAEAAIRKLEELLETDCGGTTTAIQSIRNETVQRALLNRDGPERWALFRRSHQEVERLLAVTETYMIIRMPRDFVNDLIEVVQDKLYQADLRLVIFKVLIKSIASHRSDPETYEAALNLHADKLASRLGAPVVPDPATFSHLSIEMPQHVRDTIATAENVRRLSIAEHTSALRTRPYAPRPAFGLGKNSTALTIDVERAWNPPPERRGDLPVLRKMGENVQVVYDADLEMRASLEHMGMGMWEKEQILAQRVALGCRPDQQDEFDENDDTLVEPPERPGKLSSLPDGKERMVEKEATFMGMPLEESEDEVSDADEIDHGQEADRQDADSPGSVKTDVAESGREGDESGRFVKKRKCSI